MKAIIDYENFPPEERLSDVSQSAKGWTFETPEHDEVNFPVVIRAMPTVGRVIISLSVPKVPRSMSRPSNAIRHGHPKAGRRDLMPRFPRSEIPRGTGTDADGVAQTEADHFMKCPARARWFDMRDLGQSRRACPRRGD
jgi:hypothetical protein